MHFFLSRLQEENVAKQEDRFQASAELMITWSVSLFKLDDFTLPLKLSFNRFLLADLSFIVQEDSSVALIVCIAYCETYDPKLFGTFYL